MMLKLMKWGVSALAIVAIAGCAGGGGYGGGGPSDEELIGALIADTMEALKAKDIDRMLTAYGEGFTSDQGGGIPEMKEFLQGAADQGFLDDVSIDSSSLVITVDGDKATAEPVALEGAFGAIDLGFELERQNGAWKVTYQSQS